MFQFEQDRRAVADTFLLLGSLYLSGIQQDDLPYLHAIPEFSAWLPAQSETQRSSFLDEWAAAHYRMFGMNVYPFASTFLDSSRMLGGDISDAVLDYYARGGFSPSTQSEAPDHIGHELIFSGHLIRLGDDHLLNEFLQAHLLAWLLPLCFAVKQQGNGFFSALVGATASLLEDSLDTIAGTNGPAPPTLPAPADDLLDDPETRLKDIAEYLLTPVYSGLYLSRENIAALGRETKVPRGFGDRVQILSNLFRSSVDYDQIDSVFYLLLKVVDEWIAEYSRWENHSYFAEHARFWKSRAEKSRLIVSKILENVG